MKKIEISQFVEFLIIQY